MKPGYYMFPTGEHPIELTKDDQWTSMRGDELRWNFAPGYPKPAGLKDMIKWGGVFDESKIITPHIAWASSEDAEDWNQAADEAEAVTVARNKGLPEIWICDDPAEPDPRDVMPDADRIIDDMVGECDGDNSMFYAGSMCGWLESVAPDQKADLNASIQRTICDWLIRHGHWPEGFTISNRHVRRVEVEL